MNTVSKLWVIVFGVWFILLSGAFSSWMGSPGAIQTIRLKNLLSDKQKQVQLLEQERERFEEEFVLLESNRHTQEREIRKVLGYVAQDELVFDFSASEQTGMSVASVRTHLR